MMSKGRDASEFFSDVVKNVVAKSVEVKKMVYMYLSHYCDFNHQCRELALLSINSFQKDLAASNQLVRAMALRVMTSIRVPDVIQIQLLAVKKCAGDSSPYVRKCAANAIAKLVSLSDGAEQESCDQFVATLLNDTSPMVLGSAVTAFAEVCPQNWAIFHPNYRKLCQLLVTSSVPSRDFIDIGATAWRALVTRVAAMASARARAPSNHDTRRRPTATSGPKLPY